MAEFTGEDHFSGQKNITKGNGPQPRRLATLIGDGLSDNSDILVAIQAVLDKLDLDAGVTDTDYRATFDALIPLIPRTTVV